ncbi:hypothetical protein [uncultured Stenotrophomonas sp.]|uniref:hypothetical protein n=1 Tax=uncultured Stenotrophomonas sp. TaxID=165438 RepID=UPI0025DEA62C|nr:hypothetical protein [uncultured Stenotrophomonas sp.]
MRIPMVARCAFTLAFAVVAAGCDGQNGGSVDAGADTAALKQQCWTGQADACDAYKAETGEELPYAAAAKRSEAAQKSSNDGKAKGAEF